MVRHMPQIPEQIGVRFYSLQSKGTLISREKTSKEVEYRLSIIRIRHICRSIMIYDQSFSYILSNISCSYEKILDP